MGDIADDLTEAGELAYELHLSGRCDESDCQYCQQEKIFLKGE